MCFVTHATDAKQVRTYRNAFETKDAMVVTRYSVCKHTVSRMEQHAIGIWHHRAVGGIFQATFQGETSSLRFKNACHEQQQNH